MEAKGDVYYGLHFYPGVCQYQEGDGEPYRVFLDEDTLRAMDPTFAGCPVFVLHVDEVEQDINKLRNEADGWVIESFFNEADGKHWAKFVVVSSKGKEAIAKGLKLSNCYIPTVLGAGGTWNAIDYKNRILEARYEHLAIVPNPRYEESIILNPEQFKKYNTEKCEELKKLANSKTKERKSMFSFFKRTKVENSADLDSMSVLLPKAKVEMALAKLINEADEREMKKHEPKMADDDHIIEHKGEKMTLGELKAKHDAMHDELEAMKKHDNEDEDTENAGGDLEEDPSEHGDMKNKYRRLKYPRGKPKNDEMTDDELDMEKEEGLRREERREIKDSMRNSIEARIKAEKLRNAHKNYSNYDQDFGQQEVQLSVHQLKRGKELFGS